MASHFSCLSSHKSPNVAFNLRTFCLEKVNLSIGNIVLMYEVHIEVTFKPSGFLLGSVMNSMRICEGNFSALCKTRNMDSYWNDWSIEQTEQR